MLDFAADFNTFFSDFKETGVLEGILLDCVINPIDDVTLRAEALSDIDYFVFIKKSDITTIDKRIKTGNVVLLNNKRYLINTMEDNYGILRLGLTRKDGI